MSSDITMDLHSNLSRIFFLWLSFVFVFTIWSTYHVEYFKVVATSRTITRFLRSRQIYPINYDDYMETNKSSPQKLKSRDFNIGLKSEEILSVLEDGDQYLKAPYITVGQPLRKARYDVSWSQLKLHEQYFQLKPHRRYIPTLSMPIDKLEFIRLFMMTSTPIIIPNQILKDMGWDVKPWSMSELLQKFPFQGDYTTFNFVNNGANDDSGSFGNLGAALAALNSLSSVKRINPHPPNSISHSEYKLNNGQTKYIHNMRVHPTYLKELGIDTYPPFLHKRRYQLPTIWMGSPNADTALHHDSTDNFILQLCGTKRWTIFPPTDARFIYNTCRGSLCWGQRLIHPDKDRGSLSREARSALAKASPIVIDMKAGDALYLPNGWFHHVENLNLTLMANFWTRGKSALLRAFTLNHTARHIFMENANAAPLSVLFPNVKGLEEM